MPPQGESDELARLRDWLAERVTAAEKRWDDPGLSYTDGYCAALREVLDHLGEQPR